MVQAKQLIWKNKNKEITFKKKETHYFACLLKKNQNKTKTNTISPPPNKTVKNGGHNLLAIDGVGVNVSPEGCTACLIPSCPKGNWVRFLAGEPTRALLEGRI